MLSPPTVEGLRTEILSGYDIVHFRRSWSVGASLPQLRRFPLAAGKKCGLCDALLEDEEAKGYFAYEREDGKLDALAAEELAEIVMSAPEPTRLVFLSACESAKGGGATLQMSCWWIWLFFLTQLLMGLATLRAFLDAPHRFLIRAQLAKPQSPDAFALGIKGIYCWIRDPFLLSGLILIWLTPYMTENLFLVYLIASVYLFLGSLHWESRLLIQFGEDYTAYKNEVPRMIPQRNKRWKGCRSTDKR